MKFNKQIKILVYFHFKTFAIIAGFKQLLETTRDEIFKNSYFENLRKDYLDNKIGQKYLLFSLITAHLLGADILVECEEAVEENQESHQGSGQEPGSVKSYQEKI